MSIPHPFHHVAAWLLASVVFVSAAPLAPPNVLFIAVDDLRTELGGYGAPQVKSPNIDRLAAQGVLFRRAYCQVPVCGGSRASLMTSILPTPNRFRVARTHADEDVPGCKTLPQMFKEAGYATISNGKVFHHGDDTAGRSWTEKPWHAAADNQTSLDPATLKKLSAEGRGRIFEKPDVPDNAYADGQTAEKTIADLRRLKADGKPFFLACGFLRPHLPFYAPKKYWDLYDREKIQLAPNRSRPQSAPKGLKGSGEYRFYEFGGYEDNTGDFHRMMRHGYMASVSYSDAQVGKVLAELDRLGLAENTIVVLWGDHGWLLGEHNFWGKHSTLNPAVNAPLIVRAPGKPAGKSSDALVAFVDIFPTLCSLASVPVPETAQGRSFAALLDQPSGQIRESILSRYGRGDAVVTERYIYTSYGGEGEMLYDLQGDPQEMVNLAGNPAYRDTLLRMKGLLAENQKLAADPRIPAPVRPRGAAGDLKD